MKQTLGTILAELEHMETELKSLANMIRQSMDDDDLVPDVEKILD